MMTRTTRLLAALTAAATSAACGPGIERIEPDLEPPYLVSVEPSGNSVSADAEFVVRFSEPLKESSLFWADTATGELLPEGVVFGLAEHEEALIKAADNPPLSATERAKTLAASISFGESRDTIIVKPSVPLAGLTSYTIVLSRKLSDERNNKLIVSPTNKTNKTQSVIFTTVATPDTTAPLATLVNPAPGSQSVAVELGEVRVEFSETIDASTLTAGRIGLKERSSGTIYNAASVTLDDRFVTFTLAPHPGAGCEKLCPDTEYELYVSDAVEDLSGNGVSAANFGSQSFRTALCLDQNPPRIQPESVTVVASDESVTVSWVTDESSSSVVEIVEGSGADLLDACAASSAACRQVSGASSVCSPDICALPEDPAQWSCTHTVRVTGLTPDTAYALRVVSADAKQQSVKSEAREFTTSAPLPKVEITEVFATPLGLSSVNAGKFIELKNVGSIEVDLAGWKLGRCATADCAAGITNEWTMKAPSAEASTSLEAGKYALAAGKAFDGAAMGVPAGVILLNGSTDTILSNGLTSGTSYAYVLLSPQGSIVSSYGGFLKVPSSAANNGKSFERVDPAGDDVAGNWALSTSEIASAPGNFATPGRANSVTP